MKNVLIVGGGRIAYYLTKYLDDIDIKVKIVEINQERSIKLTELLPNALIINGDGTDGELLDNESAGNMDAFISLTDKDEENLFSALLAKQCGVKKVIAKLNNPRYLDMVKNLGLSNLISPKAVISNHIFRFVRGLKETKENPMKSLYILLNGEIEAAEFIVDKSSKIINIPLSELNLSKDVLVAAIKRDKNIIIPHGDDYIAQNDIVIFICKNRKINKLIDLINLRENSNEL